MSEALPSQTGDEVQSLEPKPPLTEETAEPSTKKKTLSKLHAKNQKTSRLTTNWPHPV